MKYILENKSYELKTDWYDITISEASKITNLELPKDQLDFLLDNDEVTYDDDIMEYIIQVIHILSGGPVETLRLLEKIKLCILFIEVKKIILYIYRYNFEQHQSIGLEELTFKGKIYKIPPHMKVGEDLVIFHKEPAKNVLEVSNIMSIMEGMENKGISLLNYICAIYLREDIDEVYNDEAINKRADIFKELPLYIGYEIFFFTYFYICSLVIHSRISLEKEYKKKKSYIQKIKSLILGFFKWLKVGWSMMWKKLNR